MLKTLLFLTLALCSISCGKRKEPYIIVKETERESLISEGWVPETEIDTFLTDDPREAFTKGMRAIVARRRTDQALYTAGARPVTRLKSVTVYDKDGNNVKTILGDRIVDSLITYYEGIMSDSALSDSGLH